MNRTPKKIRIASLCALILFMGITISVSAQSAGSSSDLDTRVEKFLKENRSRWEDWNVPYQDGRLLHNLIIKNHYQKALEIGTSTGHSGVWIAWALSKTGGRLTTIEVDEGRYRTALKNFKKAGVEGLIDARLADAHQLVKELKGPFDFVFSDADKEWYTKYFKDVDPKLLPGGCFTAHNVANGFGGTREFLDYVKSLPNYQTTIDRSSSSGISISYKNPLNPLPPRSQRPQRL